PRPFSPVLPQGSSVGDTIEDLLKQFPDLEREDILACHEFARRMLAAKTIHLPLTGQAESQVLQCDK
ncbi:MAG TPA: DUF433 domain-containing protein, partial [Candidatus Limnocylindria bacterium]|nr:DUF433 domain-containing protein [Candidatus Limnocylindria bacterium]